MSEEPVFHNNSYLDELLAQKKASNQRRSAETESFLLREKYKSIGILLLAIGFLTVLLGIAIYFIRTPRERVVERVIERVQAPEIVVNVPSSLISEAAAETGFEDSLSEALTVEESRATPSNAITRSVSIFDMVKKGDVTITTGRSYEPPFDDGLGDSTEKWCYTRMPNKEGQMIEINFFKENGRIVTYESQNLGSVLSKQEWEDYAKFCG
ncbi:hypothetical protein N9513_08125 [Gammaproteobacteria bacterium]|nr:hypothetical protein [Gammaproteobacteria bacterium]